MHPLPIDLSQLLLMSIIAMTLIGVTAACALITVVSCFGREP